MSNSVMAGKITIRRLEAADWPQVLGIYLEGIATGHATFETTAPTWSKWDAAHLPFSRLLAVAPERENRAAGWAALSQVSSRAAYAGVAEVSVYVAAAFRGLGVGRQLLSELIEASERNGIWTLQAGIFPENAPSLALHLSCGFREVGVRQRVAQLHGVWRDTVLLERRSDVVGVP